MGIDRRNQLVQTAAGKTAARPIANDAEPVASHATTHAAAYGDRPNDPSQTPRVNATSAANISR